MAGRRALLSARAGSQEPHLTPESRRPGPGAPTMAAADSAESRRLWAIPAAEPGVLDRFGAAGLEARARGGADRAGNRGLRWDVGSSGWIWRRRMELRWGWVTTWRAFFIFLRSRKEEFINRELL
jgi:hypothetical protein